MLGLPFPFLAAYQRLNLALLAGSIAFRLFMWLLPFALLVAGLLGLVITQTNWNISKAVQDRRGLRRGEPAGGGRAEGRPAELVDSRAGGCSRSCCGPGGHSPARSR